MSAEVSHLHARRGTPDVAVTVTVPGAAFDQLAASVAELLTGDAAAEGWLRENHPEPEVYMAAVRDLAASASSPSSEGEGQG